MKRGVKMLYDWAKILHNKRIGEDVRGQGIYRMKLESPWIAQEARPGQFITIVCERGTFLRRPFSIAFTEKRRFIYLFYKAAGNGTRRLSQMRKGSEIDILGALGKKPFVINPNVKKWDVIYAVGPVLMLQKTARIAQKYDIPCYVLLESIVACGIGACYGCTVETFLTGFDCHQRICSDGPAFESSLINWKAYVETHNKR